MRGRSSWWTVSRGRVAERGVRGPAERLGRALAPEPVPAVGVHHEDEIGGSLDQRAETLLAPPQHLLAAFPVGDVAEERHERAGGRDERQAGLDVEDPPVAAAVARLEPVGAPAGDATEVRRRLLVRLAHVDSPIVIASSSWRANPVIAQ